jgi:HK97 family phage portal protein
MKQWVTQTIKDRFFAKKTLDSQKQSAVGGLIAYHLVGKPVWTPRRYETLTEEGYKKNVIVYRAVNLIARSAASVPWRLYDNDKELVQHPLLDLIHSPNPRQGGSAFIEAVLAYLLLSGNSYIEMVTGEEGKPVELYPLRPDRVRLIPGAAGLPAAYEYTVNGQIKRLAVNPATGFSRILHLKLFHPLNDWYGMSPLEAAGGAIDQHNTVSSHNLALLQNGGRPSGALIVNRKAQHSPMTEEQRQALQDDLRTLYEGEKNAGRMLLLEGDFEWKEMGLSPRDLDFIEGKNLSAREIAQAYGVPPMLVGVPGDATFSNYKEARYHLWEDTILPLLDQLTDELNLWLSPRFKPSLRLMYHIDAIPALAARREEAWAKLAAVNFLTINEKRQALGYAPLKEGDVLAR